MKTNNNKATKKTTTKATKTEKPLTLKEKAFCQEVITTRNATQSALKVYDTKDYKTASNIGSTNLAKPRIKQEIERLCKENKLEIKEVIKIHKRNLLQDKHLPTSQKAVKDYYDLIGLTNQEEDKTSVKVAFIIEN